MLVGSIGNVVFGEVVDEGKWTIVYGFVDHAHIVSVEDPMYKAVDLPVGDKFSSFLNDDLVHLFVGVAFVLANARVAVL